MTQTLHPDSEIIDRHGGPAKLGALLGYTGPFVVQRIQNWKYRGVPEIVKLKRPDVFGPPSSEMKSEAA